MSHLESASSRKSTTDDLPATDTLFTKIAWRIVPLLFLCYVYAYVDRVNVGMAQLQMKQTLPFGDLSYSIGASIFFVGYLLFEVPSNLMLEKIGARRTMLRIMLGWGAVSTCLMFVRSEPVFYALRFLLGAFEAGFFPGVILYLTYWFPAQRRGSIISIFLAAPVLSLLAMTPVSGAILRGFDGMAGLHGWQWLFLISGLPAILLGLVTFFALSDRPEQVTWLSDGEKSVLRKQLDSETTGVSTAAHASIRALLCDPKVYALSLVYLLFIGCVYSMIFWTPTLIKGWGINNLFWVGIYSAIPYLCGIVGMTLFGRHSDRTRERRWHFAGATGLSAAGLGITIVAQGSFTLSLLGLCVMTTGMVTLTPVFFTAVSEYVPKKTAAAGIALISSLGNLGASVIPPALVWINGRTGAPYTSLGLIIAMLLLSGGLLLIALRPARVARTELTGATRILE